MEKAGLVAMVKVHQLSVDEHYSLRGKTLEERIEADKKKGLIPFFVRFSSSSNFFIDSFFSLLLQGLRNFGNNVVLFV